MPGMVYIFNQEGYLVLWYNKALEEYEYASEEIEGKHIKDFIVSEDREKVSHTFANIFENGYDQIENIALTKSEKKLYLIIRLVILKYLN